MRIQLRPEFERAWRGLDAPRRAAVEKVLRALPDVIGSPHAHRGMGVRKLHASGIWEARVGLGLRILFAVKDDLMTLCRLGSHAEVQRFLKSL